MAGNPVGNHVVGRTSWPGSSLLLVLAGALLVTWAGCAETRAPVATVPDEAGQPPMGEGAGYAPGPVEALPIPDVSSFEPVIQQQLREVQAKVKANPGDAETAGLLGMLYHAYGLLPEAQAAYQRALTLDPRSFHWNYLLAHVLFGQAQLEDAITSFRGAVELRPDYAPARISLASTCLRAGRHEAALEVAHSLQGEQPDDPMINYLLGMTYLATNEPIRAIQYLQPVLDAHPHLGGVRRAVAKCFQQLGQEPRAVELLEGWQPNRAVPTLRDPQLVAIYRHATGTIAERRKGLAYLRRGDSPKALEHFNQALTFSPDDRVAWLGRVDALMNMGEYERCEGLLREVVDRGEGDLQALIRLAHLYITLEEYQQAEAVLQHAAALEEDNPSIITMQVSLALAREDYESAIEGLERVVAGAPRNADAHYELGRAYASADQPKAALEWLHCAVDLAPSHAAAMEALADLYWAQGENDTAAHWCRKAFDAGSRLARTYLLVATETAKGRDYGRALETLKQGLEDHPDDADLADTLARVYAMCPEATYRDWEEAMRIALALYGGDEEEVSDRGLGTLAAAHAEAENFEEAIRLTKEGIRRAKLNHDAPLLRKLARNLVHYQQGLRLYEEPE